MERGEKAFKAQDSMCKVPVAGRSMQGSGSANDRVWLQQREQRKVDPKEIKREEGGRSPGGLVVGACEDLEQGKHDQK